MNTETGFLRLNKTKNRRCYPTFKGKKPWSKKYKKVSVKTLKGRKRKEETNGLRRRKKLRNLN